MKVLHEREMRGHSFFFERGDLVVAKTALPEVYPHIEVPEGGEVLAVPGQKILVNQGGRTTVSEVERRETLEASESPAVQGVITPQGVLINLCSSDTQSQPLLDLVIANRLADSPKEYRKVEEKVGIGFQFVLRFQHSNLVRAYVSYFDQEFGTEFTPLEEPRRLAVAA